MKEYSLDVKKVYEFQSGGCVVGYWSKGHHDTDIFLESMTGLEIPEWIGSLPKPEHIQQAWSRYVPDGDGGLLLTDAKPQSQGAFPVTRFDFYKAADYELWLEFPSGRP